MDYVRLKLGAPNRGRTAIVAALAVAFIGLAGRIGAASRLAATGRMTATWTWGRLVWLAGVLLSVGVAVYAVVQPQVASEGLYGLAALALVFLVGRR